MKLLKRLFVVSAVLLVIIGCTPTNKITNPVNAEDELLAVPYDDEPEITEPKKESFKNLDYLSETIEIHNDSMLELSVLNDIKAYYQNEYEKKRIEFKKENNRYPKQQPKEYKSKNQAYLKYELIEGEGEYIIEVGMISITIPLKQGINLFMSSPILYSDLNNDGTKDLIVVVHTEGGWRGGNTYSQDIFVFLNKNGKYKLAEVTNDWDLAAPKGNGFVRVKNVEKGMLLAEAYIYTEKGLSDHYFMKYKFQDNKLVNTSAEFLGSDY